MAKRSEMYFFDNIEYFALINFLSVNTAKKR